MSATVVGDSGSAGCVYSWQQVGGSDFQTGTAYIGKVDGTSYDGAFLLGSVPLDASMIIQSTITDYMPAIDGTTGTCNLRIWGEAADNPSICTSGTDANLRNMGTAFVDWNNVAYGTSGINSENMPDLSPIFTEIIARPGWASGNNIHIFLRDNGSVGTEAYITIKWT